MKIIAALVAIISGIFVGTSNPEPFSNDETTIFLVGDIMLGRTVMTTSIDKGDYIYPFRKVTDTLSSADLVFGNLENPFLTGCPRHTDGFKFCADPRLVAGLTEANISVVTIANNHTKNYGEAGFSETKKILNDNGIEYVGDNNLVIKDINNTKFGFLGFDFFSKKPTEADYLLVSDSDKQVDVLIVGVHWGVEYKAIANEFQTTTAKRLIESGADVIAGHHPHWVQNTDEINGKPIFYSLGNFIFDQMWSEETKKGAIAKLTYKNKDLISKEVIPIYIRERGQPELIK